MGSEMVDIVSSEVRSQMMSKIRGKDTQPEMRIRRFLHAHGFRYRLHDKNLPGVPDLVFPRYRTVIFVHGCYWHRHSGCRYATLPGSNTEFWKQKFDKNVARDRNVVQQLLSAGWKVIVIWECGLRKVKEDENLSWIDNAISSEAKGYIEWSGIQEG
jgi:DNA mismatch endonuclease (patch repair protein)